MAGITEARSFTRVEEASAGADAPSLGDDLRMLAYWISLGAAAGGLGGALVGGIGGRLAMFLLRLTSDDFVRGLESDDGFKIGRFDLLSSGELVLITAVMGALVGLIMVVGRPFFPKRGMVVAWAAAGAITGGALLIHSDGIDFTLLEPHWLAVLLFIVVPAGGAAAIAAFVGAFPRFWWRNRTATAVASLAAIPVVIFFPIGIATAVTAGICLLALRVNGVRELPGWRPARVAALVVFGVIVALGANGLVRDVQAIL